MDAFKTSPLGWSRPETSCGGEWMPNERLRAALLERGVTPTQLASTVGVDPKTVERWVGGRTPYRRHRHDIAAYLELDELYLWPDALSREQVASAAESEILTVYPHRWSVPRETWEHLFSKAEREISILVYSGLFLAEDKRLLQVLEEQAKSAVRVRILLGDPDSPQVAQRGADEGIEDAMAAKIRNVFVLYRSLREVEDIEMRLHRTTLYNSIYRADDQILVNTHVYGTPASNAPVLHLRRVSGGDMVTTYLESYERVWSESYPMD